MWVRASRLACLALPCLALPCLALPCFVLGLLSACLETVACVCCLALPAVARLVWISLALPCFGVACCLPSLGLLWLSLACLWRGLAWLGLPYIAWTGLAENHSPGASGRPPEAPQGHRGRSWPPLASPGALLGRSGRLLSRSWVDPGPSERRPGALLGSWGALDGSWGALGGSWGTLDGQE